MEVLTGDTLAEALLFCSQQENVSVCVVLDNMRNTKELVETLWREIELGNLPGWVNILCGRAQSKHSGALFS